MEADYQSSKWTEKRDVDISLEGRGIGVEKSSQQTSGFDRIQKSHNFQKIHIIPEISRIAIQHRIHNGGYKSDEKGSPRPRRRSITTSRGRKFNCRYL